LIQLANALRLVSHAKKRIKQIKRDVQRGLRDGDSEDPFEMFISSTNIRYCYYKETHNILGNTFGMCVLQVVYVSFLISGLTSN
jgi:N-acetyltransferase 10